MKRPVLALFAAVVVCGPIGFARAAESADAKPLAEEILAAAAVPGGLCVHLGAGDGNLTAALSAGGRFLVHGLEPDPAMAEAAIRFIRSRGIYGQVWVEPYRGQRLPYAENLVNLLVVDDLARTEAPLREILRVLCPDGVACVGRRIRAGDGGARPDVASLQRQLAEAGFTDVQVIGRDGTWVRGRKPRPAGMDDWGHPRHGPSGNAVSGDTLVGPPRRVRWVAGPMQEVTNIVTAGGRLFYAGVIARDAFNGLRLWERKLEPTPARLGYPATAMRGSVLPVAADGRLFVVTDGRLQALDAATGKTVRVYADAGAPLEVLYDGGTLVVCDAGAVKAVDAARGKVLWSCDAAEPVGLVSAAGGVFFLEGGGAEGKTRAVVRLALATGKTVWREDRYDWAAKARRLSCHKGLLVCEVSTFTNDRPGNGIHVLDARDGKQVWERLYGPGHAHYQQGRALQTDSRLWILSYVSQDNKTGFTQWEGLDPATGKTVESFKAPGSNRCYPPVATPRFLLGAEMGFTDMATGQTDSNRITRAACGREAGLIPANGLIYAAPKHCACYPMLKSYAALAPAKPQAGPATKAPEPGDFVVERGPAFGQLDTPPGLPAVKAPEWPCYRADAWRSASSPTPVGADLKVLWTAELGDWPAKAGGPDSGLLQDWKEDPWVRGPITPPVAARGLVLVAQPDAHRVVALESQTGKVRWDVTANGRVDTPPTVWDTLCLFGTRTGTVYCVRLADGQLVWRLRVAPEDERIVAFGQLESPWPAAGSVLVMDGTAYVAAGRHPMADGGVRVLAIDPASGAVKWVKTITTLPMKNFYLGAALEFDCVDLLVAESRRPGPEGGAARGVIAMSRWQFDPAAAGEMAVAWESGFVCAEAGGAPVMVPRGLWTYGQRMDYLASGPKPGAPDTVGAALRPLAAFRGGAVYASGEDRRRLFRRDFAPEEIAAFDDKWFSQRTLPKRDAPGDRDRHGRLARGAAWTAEVFDASDRSQGIGAVLLAGDTVFVAGTRGRLLAFAAADGRKLGECDLPPAVWDGAAAAGGCLYVSTQNGRVVCLGGK